MEDGSSEFPMPRAMRNPSMNPDPTIKNGVMKYYCGPIKFKVIYEDEETEYKKHKGPPEMLISNGFKMPPSRPLNPAPPGSFAVPSNQSLSSQKSAF